MIQRLLKKSISLPSLMYWHIMVSRNRQQKRQKPLNMARMSMGLVRVIQINMLNDLSILCRKLLNKLTLCKFGRIIPKRYHKGLIWMWWVCCVLFKGTFFTNDHETVFALRDWWNSSTTNLLFSNYCFWRSFRIIIIIAPLPLLIKISA